MTEPGIKGSAIASLIADLNALRERGRISDEQLAARLTRADLEMLEHKVEVGRWYPLAGYGRMVELLWDLEGARDPGFLHARGASAARRLADAGLYPQLDKLKEVSDVEHFADYRSRLRLIASLHGALINCGRWRVEDDPGHADRIAMIVEDAAAYPEVLRHTLEGFVNEASRMGGSHARWTSERPNPATLVFRMDRGFRR